MPSFYAILCAFFIQLRFVLGLVYLVRIGSSISVTIALYIQNNLEPLS